MRVLTWTILLFAVFTGLCALAQGYWDLLVYRTIAGLGLGGEFGIGMALVAEAWPARQRARVSSYVGLGWQLGVLAAALVTPLLLPVIGWRGMFALGIVAGAWSSFFVRRRVDEPEVFVEQVARRTAQGIAAAICWSMDAATTKLSIGMVILCSVQNFGYYGVMIWLPSYLSTRFGFALTQSAVVDRRDHCSAWRSASGCSAISPTASAAARPFSSTMPAPRSWSCVYSQLTDPTALLIGGAVMGFFVNGMLGGYGALISELYPTAARATAQNVLFNIGRAVGGFGPVVVGALAACYSFETAIALLAALYCLDILALWFLIPDRRGAALS